MAEDYHYILYSFFRKFETNSVFLHIFFKLGNSNT